jgi:hypothetical protein
MSKQNGKLDRSLGQVTEALIELFARARELEALSPDDLAGVRMRQLVQIERARMDFERFREMLVLEATHLHRSLDAALAGVRSAPHGTEHLWAIPVSVKTRTG